MIIYHVRCVLFNIYIREDNTMRYMHTFRSTERVNENSLTNKSTHNC